MKLPFQWGWIDKDLLSLASDPWDLKLHRIPCSFWLSFFFLLKVASATSKYMGVS